MSVEISSAYDHQFLISDKAPEEFKTYLIPGSEISYLYTSFATVLLQQFRIKGSLIAHLVFKIEEAESFTITSQEVMSNLFFSIRGDAHCVINDQEINISEGRFNVFFQEKKAFNLTFNKEGEYVVLIIFLSKEFMQQQLIYFPSLENLENSIIQNKTSIVFLNENYITIKMFDCIHQLLHSPYSEATERFHSAIIKKLLRLSFKKTTAHNDKNLKFSLEYLESLYTAKNYIDTHLLQHDTISQISRKAGINELKLKKGFKEIFGAGVYGYRKRERLRIAKIELEQTQKSIKQVARNAGYRNANNFSSAFKKMFGVSPQSLRKKS